MTSLIIALTLLFSPAAASGSSLEAIRQNFIQTATYNFAPDAQTEQNFLNFSGYGRANDVLQRQLYIYGDLPAEEVERVIGLFDYKQGCWTDIDYADKNKGGWFPCLHLVRLQSMTKLYVSPTSAFRGDERLGRMIHSAIAYWGEVFPVCPNWWHNEIGSPKMFCFTLLMLGDEMTPKELEYGLKVLGPVYFHMTGQNLVWVSTNLLMKGLLTNDEELVRKAVDTIESEIRLCPPGNVAEGIQPDWSFHQHGPQMQFGNYGLSFADGLAFWYKVLEGTDYAFSDDKARILRGYLKEGLSWCYWKGMMDPNACGRQPFLNGPNAKAATFSIIARHMSMTSCEDAEFFGKVADANVPDGLNSLIGARYFPNSDFGVYRTAKWYSSVRMHSSRTVGFEFTNNENQFAHFCADGALLTLQDGKEYNNIFPVWDWRKLPGVTAFYNGTPLPAVNERESKANNSEEVYGKTDGNIMATTITVDRDSLHAVKADFFFEDMVVALGCGIGTTHTGVTELTTGIEQNNLCGKIRRGRNWVHHNRRGYITLDGASILVTDSLQHGNWYPIDHILPGKEAEAEVFKAWLEHDSSRSDNSYAYAILPMAKARATRRAAARPSVQVIRNDEVCQAVRKGKTVCAVFHKAGSISVDGRTISSDKADIIISM